MSSPQRSLALVLAGALGAGTLVGSTDEDTGPRPDGPPVVSAPAAVEPPMNIAFVANGVSMVDALSVGAAAGRLDASVLTTRQDRLVNSARTTLEDLDPQLVFVVGGDIAIADTVIEEIATATGLTEVPLEPPPTAGIVRIAGSDRYATSAAVAGLADVYDAAFASEALEVGQPFAVASTGSTNISVTNTPASVLDMSVTAPVDGQVTINYSAFVGHNVVGRDVRCAPAVSTETPALISSFFPGGALWRASEDAKSGSISGTRLIDIGAGETITYSLLCQEFDQDGGLVSGRTMTAIFTPAP